MNKDALIAATLALVLGLGGGYAISQATHDHYDSDMTTMSMGHSHGSDTGTFEVSAENAPTVQMVVEEDAKSGWNVSLETTNFEFAPQNVNDANVEGEGHAHLYVDGEKVARLYAPDFHYDAAFDGTKTFKVVLNANNHSPFTVNGEEISDTVQVAHEAHSN